MMNAVSRWGCRLTEGLMVLMLAAMVVMVFANVALRYLFDSGLSASEELARWLFVWMTFLGAALALREGGHMGADLVIDRLPRPLRRALQLFTLLSMAAITVLMLQGAWAQMVINRETVAPGTGAPVAWFYASGVVFAVGALLALGADIVAVLRGQPTAAERALADAPGEAHGATPSATRAQEAA
jgi:TRAP-type C4-dicarboxylate transport system permease small subunit